MIADMAQDLRPHNVATLAIWPGWVATERVMAGIRSQGGALDGLATRLETAEFTGLVIDAIYRDLTRMRLSGHTVIAAELARDYGINDLNGHQPPSYRDTMGAPPVRSTSM